jgi:hypothetical protein
MLDRDRLIERLCALQEEVWKAMGRGEPADCFCGKGGYWKTKEYGPTYEEGYRNAGHALEFIERATWAALRRRRRAPKTSRE